MSTKTLFSVLNSCFLTDSLEAVVTGLGVWFVVREYFKKAVFGAEDICESLLLVSCLALHHAFLAVGAVHLCRLRGE